MSHLDAFINSMKDAKCYRGSCSSKAVGKISFVNPIHSDMVFGTVKDDTNTKANVAGHAVTTLLLTLRHNTVNSVQPYLFVARHQHKGLAILYQMLITQTTSK